MVSQEKLIYQPFRIIDLANNSFQIFGLKELFVKYSQIRTYKILRSGFRQRARPFDCAQGHAR